jgi:hypothetical protein
MSWMTPIIDAAEQVVIEYVVEDDLSADAVAELNERIAALALAHGQKATSDGQQLPHTGDHFIDACARIVNEYVVEDDLSADAVSAVNDLLPSHGRRRYEEP